MSIALDQVTKRYQSLPVVNDVSIEIQQGEFLVLLGPSGSGKSRSCARSRAWSRSTTAGCPCTGATSLASWRATAESASCSSITRCSVT